MSSRRMATLLAVGGAARFLLCFTPLPDLLLHRNELTTPLTSFTRLKEGYYLADSLKLNPYDAGSFHAAPLLLLLGPLTTPGTPAWLSHLLWILVECVTAYFLGSIADRRTRRLQSSDEKKWPGWWVAALYLLHPFSVGTALARSTIVFTNLFIALAISSALDGALLPLAFSLSLATHLSLYPALILPPLILLAAQSRTAPSAKQATTDDVAEIKADEPEGQLQATAITVLSAFIVHQGIVTGLSWWITGGSWAFLSSVYGVTLTLPDLTPSIGLGWYFFIEMFDHFRTFFVGVFQLHVLCYVAPLTYCYRRDPLFTVLLLLGVIAIFKSYPSLGDFALWHAMLATYSELGGYLSHPLFLFCLTTYSLFLLPTFHHLWLYSGSGNANFFYASTLVWTISQGGLLVDVMDAKGKRAVFAALEGETQGEVKLGAGEATLEKGEAARLVREGNQLTADVISIEASKSDLKLLEVFKKYQYPNAIGPGVYDIHSPRVPSVEELQQKIAGMLEAIPQAKDIFVNPDCGLKTRGWDETEKSLAYLVAAAKWAREKYANKA